MSFIEKSGVYIRSLCECCFLAQELGYSGHEVDIMGEYIEQCLWDLCNNHVKDYFDNRYFVINYDKNIDPVEYLKNNLDKSTLDYINNGQDHFRNYFYKCRSGVYVFEFD